jgi:hypothetical protein
MNLSPQDIVTIKGQEPGAWFLIEVKNGTAHLSERRPVGLREAHSYCPELRQVPVEKIEKYEN